MRIVFLHVRCSGEYSRWGDSLARLMIESCKRVMPEIPVVHLTDHETPGIETANTVERLPADDVFLMPFKLKHLSLCETPFIFLDTDILITQPLEVWDRTFDVAMVRPQKSVRIRDNTDVPPMPYNAGFIACRNRGFFRDCHQRCSNYPEKYKEWFGDQIAIGEVAPRYNVHDLKDEWNHPVNGPEDLGAKVLHYKGEKRKAWMPKAFDLLKASLVV